MKKQLLSMLASSVLATCAHAQSSVTLYGSIDEGITYNTNNLGHGTATLGPVAVPDFYGIRGIEDLGGGNKVLFRLENGFSLETGALGQGGRLFGRSAWVALQNSKAGTITLGRQYNSVQDYLSNLQINGVGALSQYANAIYDNDDLNNTYRTNNAVKYTTKQGKVEIGVVQPLAPERPDP